MTLAEAIKVARTGARGSVHVNEPWVLTLEHPLAFGGRGSTTFSPGLVDLDYLRRRAAEGAVRAWRPEDAR